MTTEECNAHNAKAWAEWRDNITTQAAEAERAKVVKWLRAEADKWTSYENAGVGDGMEMAADAIEQGAHLEAPHD